MDNSSLNKNYDVIIVGGGITGIISAVILSQKKRKVLLVERTGEYGGLFKMTQSHGETFFFGAHHLAGVCKDSIVGGLLSKVGINVEEDIEKITYMKVINCNKTYVVPLNLDELEDYLKRNYPNESKIEDFFCLVRRYQKYFREGNESGLLKMFVDNSQITYLELLKKYFENDEIIKILTLLGPGYGGIGPRGVAFNNLSLLISYSLGSGYFKDKNEIIINRLISLAKENGCVCVTNTECVDIILKDREVRGVVCRRKGNEEEYFASTVLFTSYPFNVLKKYISGSRLEKKLKKFEPGPSVIRVCGLLDKVPDSLLGDTVYMGNYGVDDLDDNILLESNAQKLPVCMIHIYREKQKIKFMYTFQVQASNKRRISQDALVDLIKREFPEIANNIKKKVFLYDNWYKAITNTEWGSVFGWQRTPYNYLNTNSYTPVLLEVKGVYIAGNWSTDYGMYGALRTSKKACDLILKEGEEK